MSKREVKLYVNDIIEAIDKIETYIKDLDFTAFSKDNKTIDAVMKNLLVIGEAINNLSSSFKEDYPDIPWSAITGMRNKMIHEYFGVDEKVIWETIKNDLPPLKEQIQNIFKNL